VPGWSIVRSWRAQPQEGSGRGAAFAFALEADRPGQPVRVQVTVDYAASSTLASATNARELVSRHLGDDVAPRRLIVDRDGGVSPRSK
jgi:hypothetical protein